MNRPWPAGRALKSWAWLFAAVLGLAGIGTVFGLRLHAIAVTAREVQALKEALANLQGEIAALEEELKKAGEKKVVEEKAREILHWAYPNEEIVILLKRR